MDHSLASQLPAYGPDEKFRVIAYRELDKPTSGTYHTAAILCQYESPGWAGRDQDLFSTHLAIWIDDRPDGKRSYWTFANGHYDLSEDDAREDFAQRV